MNRYWRQRRGMMIADGDGPQGGLGGRLSTAVTRRFETMVNGVAFTFLIAAAILAAIGAAQAVIEAASLRTTAMQGGTLVLDRILLVLIIAELAYTIRTVIVSHEIAAEPFLFVGLIATVRRILIVTARFEEPQSNAQLDRLLLELGVLALLVVAIAAAIMMIRYCDARFARSRREPI
ncbi:phosphate-starvation-inducible PsiE family protein [Mycobacterium sp. SM1]|uniref:phosphate-starvation-inducible PsiE family protein n=1 Tax=Mycobacterium sp. SM1 TaxID=2816243 RepID=UPI001F379765|nr:phosphate-starvation-inducible PsiE family protein [Mycobacterium sp. SM1]